jgi:hypothetical protein
MADWASSHPQESTVDAAANRLALSLAITGSSLAMCLVGFFGHQLPFAPF